MRHVTRTGLLVLLPVTATALSSLHVTAENSDQWSRNLQACFISANSETVARACTAVIERGRETPADLARAHLNRAGMRVMTDAHGRVDIERDADRAIADFSDAIRLDPALAHAYEARARAYHQKRDFERALADLAEAIRLVQAHRDDRRARPELGHIHVHRGDILRDMGDFARAIEAFNAALAAKPREYNRALAIHERGVTFRMMRDLDRALADFDALVEDNDWSPARAFADRGWVHLLRGEPRRASSDFSNALGRMEHRAALVLALYGRGLARHETGDPAGGRADHAAAQAVDHILFRQLDQIGPGLLLGGAEKAHVTYDSALRVNPDRGALAWVMYGRGVMRQRFGDSTGAKADQAAARIIDAVAVDSIVRQKLN